MNRTRKIITASVAALTLAGTVAATATPAAAWGKHHHHGGWGPGAAIGLGVGALAIGALAASSGAYAYDTCISRQAVYDDWGNFRGYRRVRVAC